MTEEKKTLKVRPVMQVNIADTGQIILQGESTYMEDKTAFVGLMGRVMIAMEENFARQDEKKIQVIQPKIDLSI